MRNLIPQLMAIIGGTFVSEDLTCISTGLLIRESHLNPLVGLGGCLAGIVAGDFALWLLGRVGGRRVLQWVWIQRRLSGPKLARLQHILDERLGTAVLAVRFLPGTRAVLYVVAGALGSRPGKFLGWSLVAALIWTPLLVFGTALFGDIVVTPLASLVGSRAWAMVTTGGCLLATLNLAPIWVREESQSRWIARLSRLWRWEFWPSWLFYLPLLPWLAILAVRYRSATVWTAANPGIPQGGVVGESKFAILCKLPTRWTLPSVLIDQPTVEVRVLQLQRNMQELCWSFPLILKPDASQRGAGVKRVHTIEEATRYLGSARFAVIAQPYHPGPFEAGIFYVRLPGAARGRILSITDKQFPQVTGDGHATLAQLIWRHPRLRMQGDTFLNRHTNQQDRVLAAGETMQLAVAGNHCQGTMFRDGSHLITPELEQRIDAIAQHFAGFHFGRFDVRYTDERAFLAGDDLAIVELNGVTSESTNLYDPAHSLRTAYAILFRQWALLFQIGNANRRRGIQPTTMSELVAVAAGYFRGHRPDPLAD